jgi:hypothetical protein
VVALERESSVTTLLLSLLLGCHLVWLYVHFLPVAVGPDAGGLFVQARLLATELSTGFDLETPVQYLGNHWLQTEAGDFHSRFPPGFPILLALAWLIGGPQAPFFLNPLLATGVVGMTFLVGRRWLGGRLALWAAVIVAALSPLNRLALHGDAHVAATAAILLGIWLLFRWEDEPTWGRAALAGLAWGVLPTLRYPEAILGFAVAAFFLLGPRGARLKRGLIPAACGAAVPIFLLCLHNALVYGAPWRTGYGLTSEQTAFAWSNLWYHLGPYLQALVLGGAGPFFVLGLLGILWMIARRDTRSRGVLFLGIILPLTLLYAAYYWGTAEEPASTLRYLLPTLPVYVLAAFWILKWVVRTGRRRSTTIAVGLWVLLSLVQLGRALPEGSRFLLGEWMGLARGRAVVEAVEGSVPPGSVLVGPREIQEILDYYGRWKLVGDRMLPGTPAHEEVVPWWELTEDVRSELASRPGPVQLTRALEDRARYTGLGDPELARLVLSDMREWAGPEGELFWVGTPSTVTAFAGLVGNGFRFHSLGAIPLPGEGEVELPYYWIPKGPLALFRLEWDGERGHPPTDTPS